MANENNEEEYAEDDGCGCGFLGIPDDWVEPDYW
jgi:hypothetical protein